MGRIPGAEEAWMSGFLPCLIETVDGPARLADALVDEYLRFTAARMRPNTLLAQEFDLKVFFTVVGKPATEVTPMCWRSSSRSVPLAGAGTWSGSPMGTLGCPRRRSSGGWRRCPRCSTT